jgi:Family of unknown function (DUF6580)
MSSAAEPLADAARFHTMVPMNAIINQSEGTKTAMTTNQTNPAPRPLSSALMMLAGIVLRYPARIKPPNFTMVGGMSLFAGARYPLWQALGLPLIVMLISDMWLKLMFDFKPFNWFVYGSFVVYVLLGRLLRKTQSPLKIGSLSVLASLQFFLITNFGVWYMGIGRPTAIYEPNLLGLLTCYAAALPFLAFTVAGDLGFAAVLFGAHAFATADLPIPAPRRVEAPVGAEEAA